MATPNDTTPTKTCTKCERELPATTEYFHRKTDSLDGFRERCKSCRKPETQDYYTKNRDKVLAANTAWRKQHPEEMRRYKSDYEDRHPERVAQAKRDYINRNRDKERRRGTLYRINNADKKRESAREWARRNKEYGRLASRNRRAKTRGVHTQADIDLQYKSQKGLCWWCGKLLDPKKYHADHLIPLSRGGTNEARNIVLAHPKCNQSKHNKMPWEWIGRLL